MEFGHKKKLYNVKIVWYFPSDQEVYHSTGFFFYVVSPVALIHISLCTYVCDLCSNRK